LTKQRRLFVASVLFRSSCRIANSRRGCSNTGPDLRLFFHELIANRISGFFAMDVIISAVVLLLFIQSEGKRLRMCLLWLPSIGTLIVGLSLGLPLFLYLRQVKLDRVSAEA